MNKTSIQIQALSWLGCMDTNKDVSPGFEHIRISGYQDIRALRHQYVWIKGHKPITWTKLYTWILTEGYPLQDIKQFSLLLN